ncbi:MAG: peptidase M15 [Microviridae sp.]|nr:MAG: peptidase M15 [Microviridae sp.]
MQNSELKRHLLLEPNEGSGVARRALEILERGNPNRLQTSSSPNRLLSLRGLPPRQRTPVTDSYTARVFLEDPVALETTLYRDQKVKNWWRTSRATSFDPDLLNFALHFTKHCEKLTIPMWIAKGYYSYDQQTRDFIMGRSHKMAGDSAHNYGMACDIIHSRWGYTLDNKCWELVYHIGNEVAHAMGVKVRWGGLSRPEHWEIPEWQRLRTTKT